MTPAQRLKAQTRHMLALQTAKVQQPSCRYAALLTAVTQSQEQNASDRVTVYLISIWCWLAREVIVRDVTRTFGSAICDKYRTGDRSRNNPDRYSESQA